MCSVPRNGASSAFTSGVANAKSSALTELAVDILGEDGADWDSPWTYRLLRSRANSIEGGTTEILKNIIAERVLGLPKLR